MVCCHARCTAGVSSRKRHGAPLIYTCKPFVCQHKREESIRHPGTAYSTQHTAASSARSHSLGHTCVGGLFVDDCCCERRRFWHAPAEVLANTTLLGTTAVALVAKARRIIASTVTGELTGRTTRTRKKQKPAEKNKNKRRRG